MTVLKLRPEATAPALIETAATGARHRADHLLGLLGDSRVNVLEPNLDLGALR